MIIAQLYVTFINHETIKIILCKIQYRNRGFASSRFQLSKLFSPYPVLRTVDLVLRVSGLWCMYTRGVSMSGLRTNRCIFTGRQDRNCIRYEFHSFHNARATCITFALKKSLLLRNGGDIRNIKVLLLSGGKDKCNATKCLTMLLR